MDELRQWLLEAEDDVVQLSEIASSKDSEGLIEDVLALIESDPETQNSSTWILKFFVDSGVDLNLDQAMRLSNTLGKLTHWQSKVHILQLSAKSKTLTPEIIVDWAKGFTSSSNKFLTAWAIYISVLGLAKKDPKLSQDLLRKGLASESGSIRARAKKAAEQVSKMNTH
jgi:hypothetical protein